MKKQNRYPLDNPAKSTPYDRKKSPERILKEKEEKKALKKKRIGLLIAFLQGVLSVVALGILFAIDMLPFMYTGIVVLVLAILLFFTWKTQSHKGIHIAGKVIGILMIMVLSVAIYGLIVVNQAFGTVAKEQKKDKQKIIYETVFSISINEKGKEKVWIVNKTNRQILEINVPDNYYMLIPDVSEGKKDTLKVATEYGEKAVRQALGYLYETKIPYRAEIKSNPINDLKGNGWMSIFLQPKKFIKNIDENLETNLSKEQIRQLVKLYMEEEVQWDLFSIDAQGEETKQTTYTNAKEKTTVVEPEKRSVKKLSSVINQMEDGEKLEKKELEKK